MSVADLPKIELHLHLEGAAPPGFIRGLAKEKHIDLSRIFRQDGTYAYRDFGHFLTVYEAATEVLQTPDDFARLTTAVLEESARNGVIYTEAFLSPDFCGGRDVGAWKEYLQAIREAADRAERETGVVMRGIVTCIRHFGPDKAKQTARCAAETAGDWLTGFGMGGDEAQGRQGDFAYAFDMAAESGLRLTTHAGEWGGPDSVRQALHELRGIERLGHGVRASEDPALVTELADRGVVLECCPGSNVTLGLYPSVARHPIARLREAGVKVTVSTDDPPFFHATMRREYEDLERAFGWNAEVFTEINETAAEAAFCDEATRKHLKERLRAAL